MFSSNENGLSVAQLQGKCMLKRAENCFKGRERKEEKHLTLLLEACETRVECLAVDVSKSRLSLAICCKSFALQSQ